MKTPHTALKNTVVLSFLILTFLACSSDDNNNYTIAPPETIPKKADLSHYDNGRRVMMQAFYWDVEPRFEWWNTLSEKVEDWAATGVDRIWLPVTTKGQSGGYSMGYDPSDYFDFGEFDQHGTIPTRFGTREQLENLIQKAHNNGLEVIADIVLNHNSGGGEEYNPYRDKNTYTLFETINGNASGKFDRSYEDFHPNSLHEHDEEALFFEEQDLCHHQPRVQEWLWKGENSVARYYKNTMKFDGWRFDYVKGFGAWVVKAWNDEVGGFSVGEYWDGHAPTLVEWVEASGSAAFDFACFYKLDEALDRKSDLNVLEGNMLWKTHPEKAVTFVANHDTEKDENPENNISAANKMLAYAYILTHTGYPTVFYGDYENNNYKSKLKNLIRIHNSIATGDMEILHQSEEEYIMKRNGSNGNPGLIFYMNIGTGNRQRTVLSNWKEKKLVDYSNNTSAWLTTDSQGEVTIEAPARGFAIWSVSGE
ncbi:alpha-amylase [Sinomicrobium pectinilyticum]|uniref:Alpha-amylase n=2 Tax=Flavobacteriaceae TaxID=49546 RepID=A0A3N0E7I5_SINP1|nr:alpha-amylase [Sinomicrobium pectinilyticum]AGD88873.1 amylase [Flavobacteriaceae bacterium BPA]RNL83750.1 alpha-amylase [Sinomicrobium pectinilyticum]